MHLMARCTKTATKTIRIMKLTALLLFTAFLQVSATGYSQNITLLVQDAPLQKVLQEIEKQTGFSFIYGKSLIDKATTVTLDVKNQPLQSVLEMVFKDQPLRYQISDKYIVLSPRPAEKPMAGDAAPQPGVIQGRVINAKGEPLANAYLIVKRTKTGTTTNVKGEFTLKNVRPEDVITVSFVGYKPQTFKVSDPKDGDMYVRTMQVSDDQLDQVVIQAYGTTSQRYTTGDISTVTAEEIEKQPVMNPLMALQGRVAGLEITQTSGYASGPVLAEIRGRSGIADLPSDPLYIIDGVPLTVLPVGATQGYNTGSAGFLQNSGLAGPAQGQSPLFSIAPSDIESITVLKDADATSIYGSRGANGVILINTKKGKAGQTQFNVHVDQGVNVVTRYWDMMNTPQYLLMRREAFKNDGITPNQGNAPDLLVWDTTRNTDWQRALYGKAGKVVNAQISLSGGDLHTTFRISGSYTNSTEITTASGSDQRGAVSFNVSHSTSDRLFNISFTSTYSFTQSDMIGLPGKVTYAPDAPAIYDSTGKLNWAGWESSIGNPFGSLLQPYVAKTDFLNSNLVFRYTPVRGLTVQASMGYNNGQSNQTFLIPIASQDPNYNPTGTAQFGNNSNTNWIVEPQISYDAQIGRGKFNAVFGGSAQSTITNGIFINGSGYTSDALLRTISNAPNNSSTDNYGEYRYASVFARVGYNLDNKYIINLNARRDGSSNYGPGNQYGNFASIGAAWIFTDENWFKEHPSFLSFGKFHASYGTAGSDGGKPYAYITRWASNGQTYDGVVPLTATQHANPTYQWQENRKLEAGINLGFFKDWITLSVAYYRNRTSNQLLDYPTPWLSGFSSVLANLNALVQNQGWEFAIAGKGVHVHSKYFNWDWAPHFNFSVNQNEFVSFPGLGSSPFRNNGQLGQPLNGLYLLHFTGVDPQTGQYTFQDRNHDGAINPNYVPPTGGDVYFKKLSPTFSTGFGFNFDLKGFSLVIFFLAKKQEGINAIAQSDFPGRFNANQSVEVLARWQNPGDITSVGKFSTRGYADPNGYLSSSDVGYTDASYIRLQNLALSYRLPDPIAKKAGFQCDIFVHASNLLTITGYKGIDPEVQHFGGMPPSRTIVGGLSFNF
jgi:TonB-linked SusC/RagA family outer membrane protein